MSRKIWPFINKYLSQPSSNNNSQNQRYKQIFQSLFQNVLDFFLSLKNLSFGYSTQKKISHQKSNQIKNTIPINMNISNWESNHNKKNNINKQHIMEIIIICKYIFILLYEPYFEIYRTYAPKNNYTSFLIHHDNKTIDFSIFCMHYNLS